MNSASASKRSERLIAAGRLLAIVRVPRLTEDSAAALTDLLVDAGVQALEFTLDSAGALEAIGVAQHVAAGRATVGAGTVMTVEQVERVAEAGAQFVVSPDVNSAVITRTVELGLLSLPGAYTATEVRLAVDHGADMVKLFPAGPGGVDYLRALRGPLPSVRFVPTGGIADNDVAGFLEAGATAVGIGSALVRSADDLSGLADRARRFVAAASPVS